MLGAFYAQRGEVANAEAEYKAALRLSRQYTLAAINLADLYRRARALVLPNCEEFGIAAVEAEASGRPVLAVDAGGAKETVVPGLTGALVPDGDVDLLVPGHRRANPAAEEAVAARDGSIPAAGESEPHPRPAPSLASGATHATRPSLPVRGGEAPSSGEKSSPWGEARMRA